MNYTNDYDSYLPKSSICEYGYYWSNFLYAATSGKPLNKTGACPNGDGHQAMNNYIGYSSTGNTREAGTMFHCPSQTVTYTNSGAGTKPNPISYGMGWFLGGSPAYSSTDITKPWLKITRLQVLSEAMLAMEPDTRVLFISGYPSDVITHKELLPNGAPFLQKPVAPMDLLKKIREILDHQEG